jgi:GxxExxY protein
VFRGVLPGTLSAYGGRGVDVGAGTSGPVDTAKHRANSAELRDPLGFVQPNSNPEIKIILTNPNDHKIMTLDYDTTLTHQIIGLAMRVHTSLGPGLLESAYERCLCHELDHNGIEYATQVPLPLTYRGTKLDCGYRADLIVRNEVLLELKSVEQITPLYEAQLQTYLRLSTCRVGLLLNFNTVSLKDGIRRRVQSPTRNDQ